MRSWGGDSSRLIAKIDRISSNSVNEPFITEQAKAEGWDAPYSKNLTMRKITLGKELTLYRVHTDETWPYGRFLAREKEIAPFLNNPEALKVHLGLPDIPVYITEVNVPAETKLYVGRIGAQKNFGLMEESGFQYQLQNLSDIPRSSYTNTRQILTLTPSLDY